MSRVATVNHSTCRLALLLPHPVTFMFRTVTVSIKSIGSRPMETCSTPGAKKGHYRGSLPFPTMFLRTEKAECWSLIERRIIASKFLTLTESFLSEWPGRLGPCGLYIDADDTVYIAEGGGVSIFNRDGRLLTCWNVLGGPDDAPHGAHGIWVDRNGDIYIGEVGVENSAAQVCSRVIQIACAHMSSKPTPAAHAVTEKFMQVRS